MDKRDIAAVERARADEILKRALGVVIFCREHKARGIAIQAMHDAGAVLTLHSTKMIDAAVVDQSVRKGAALVAMGGMAHQAPLLGEHDKVVVLVADIEGNGLGNHVGRVVRLGQVDRDAIAGAYGVLFRETSLTVDGNGASLDQMRAGRARGTAIVGAQIGVKTLTSGIVGNKNMDVGH